MRHEKFRRHDSSLEVPAREGQRGDHISGLCHREHSHSLGIADFEELEVLCLNLNSLSLWQLCARGSDRVALVEPTVKRTVQGKVLSVEYRRHRRIHAGLPAQDITHFKVLII